jgi:hypothetical protein
MSTTRGGAESGDLFRSLTGKTGSVRRRRISATLATIAGVVVALLATDLALRPWGPPLYWANVRPVAEDSLSSPVLTFRNYEEGIATAHFTPSGARLTGNPPIPGAPYILIVGDSFTAELQVKDRETIGGQVEALSRSAGHGVNIRQYGWIAAGPAKYIVEAPELRAKWRPAMTVVILNLDDFVPEALNDHWTVMRFKGNGSAEVVRVPPLSRNKGHALVQQAALKSPLLHELLAQFTAIELPLITKAFASIRGDHAVGSSGAPVVVPSHEEIIRESVSQLHRAYGDNLLLIFASEPGLQDLPDPTDTDLLADCKKQGVDCLSTRADFIAARDSGRFLAAGFGNSQPGAGHYNTDGIGLIARDIWRDYCERRGETL